MRRSGCLSFLLALMSLTLISAGAWVWHLAPIRNPKIEFGYYGRYHQVQRVILQIPGTSIVDSWKHEDIVLEDFGFTIQLGENEPKRVDFWDGTPVKENGDDAEIRAYVLAELQRPATAVR